MNDLNQLYETSSFEIFSKKIFNELLSDESISMTLAAEKTLFSRLSNAKVRQMTNLNQAFIDFSFIKGNKTLSFNLPFKATEDDFLLANKKSPGRSLFS